MSKSRGNDVDPVDISNRLGGEIVRLWSRPLIFREDVVGSEPLMQRRGGELSQDRTACFQTLFVSSISMTGSTQKHAVPFDQMQAIDRTCFAKPRSCHRMSIRLVRRVRLSQDLPPRE